MTSVYITLAYLFGFACGGVAVWKFIATVAMADPPTIGDGEWYFECDPDYPD